MTYSIHTIMLRNTISFSQFFRLNEILKRFRTYQKGRIIRVYSYYMEGITRFEIIPIKDESSDKTLFAHFKVIINPSFRAEARLVKPENLQTALERIFKRLANVIPSDIIEDLQISRIDFTGDLQMQTQEQAEEYIALLKKGRQIRSLEEKIHYDYVEEKWETYDESWCLECGSYEFQVYSKYEQMIARKLSGAEYARGIVRFEMRCGRDKIRAIAKKHRIDMDMPVMDVLCCLAYAAPESEIKSIMGPSVGTGSFCTLAELKKRVQQSSNQLRVKTDMIRLAMHIAHAESVQEMINDDMIRTDRWRILLRKFNEIGCSPIPIPARAQYKTAPGVMDW